MQKQFEYNGLSVNYNDEGSGAVMVLVHGFAEDGSVWQGQTNFLALHYRVMVPDLPGSGLSAYNPSLATIGDFANVLQALLAYENITTCIMLGHSLGGYITLAFAENYPESLTGFGLVHSTAFADSEEKKLNREKGIKLIGEYGTLAFIKNTTPNLFSASFKRNYTETVEQLIEKGAGFSKGALQQYYTAMMTRPDRTNVLTNSTKPVLFIAGAQDIAVPLADLLQQVHLPKTSQICILENAGHMGMWEEKNKTNEAIATFAKYANWLAG